MTALNFCFDAHRVAIASDSLVSNRKEATGAASKVVFFQHIHCAIAAVGELEIFASWIHTVMTANKIHDITTLNELSYNILPMVWDTFDGERVRTTVFTFGFDEDDSIVSGFSSPSFEQQTLLPGLYVNPDPLREEQPAVGNQEINIAHPIDDSPIVLPPWHDQVRAITKVTKMQRDKYPIAIGGRVHVLTMTPDSIHQASPFNLDDDVS